MKGKTGGVREEKCLRTCRMGLWLSKSEKDRFKQLAKKEHFSTLSQYIRHRCLQETVTNSELVDKLMILIGQEFLKEYLRYYPTNEEKVYSEENLVKPRPILKSSNCNSESHKIKKNEKIKMERTLYIGFLLTEEEKFQMKLNATHSGFKTVSKFIRNRCMREQINKNEIITILISFIIRQLNDYSVGSDRNLQWIKKKVGYHVRRKNLGHGVLIILIIIIII